MLRNALLAIACATGVGLLMVTAQGQTLSRNGPPRDVRRVTDFVPYKYIVVLKQDAESRRNASESRKLARSHGARIEHLYEHALNAFAIDAPEFVARMLLERDPRIDYIEEVGVFRADHTDYAATWGIDRIDQRSLPLSKSFTWGESDAGGIDVLIVDSGIRPTHSEFRDLRNPAFGPRIGPLLVLLNGSTEPTDFIGGDGIDCDGHGTHVAGTIIGATVGIARALTARSLRVFPCDGTVSTNTLLGVIDFITRYSRPGYTVVNMSLGGPPQQALDDAVRNSIARGIVYVVSAGNDDRDASNASPARVSEAITVGASSLSDARATWDSGGGSNFGSGVDIFAPGKLITSAFYTTDSILVNMSGTSMAAPHVTGVVASYLASFVSHQSVGSFGAAPPTPAEVSAWLVNQSTKNVLTGLPAGTPNRLLYSGGINDSAGFQVHPFRMRPGQKYWVSMAVENRGTTSWSSTGTPPYLLGNRSGISWGADMIPLDRPTCCGATEAVKSGEPGVFNFEVTAPVTAGTYPFNWQMQQSPGNWFGDQCGPCMLGGAGNSVQVGNWADDAAFVSMSVPQQMVPGGQYEVQVRMRNTGTSSWLADWNGFGGYWLGSISEAQTTENDWGVSFKRVDPPTELAIPPGQEVAFTFTVRAPTTPGWKRFQWQMQVPSQLGGPFGSPTPWKQVFVGTTFNTSSTPPQTTVTSLAPASGAPGASVVITGTNFASASYTGPSSVRFNGVLANFVVNSATQLTATVPTGADTGRITVTTPLGTGASNAVFWVSPAITSFSPPSAVAGATVTIRGLHLDGVKAVTFNGKTATFSSVESGSTTIAAVVPAGGTSGRIAVTTPGGTATSVADFLIAPAINSFTPASGPSGTSVTIKGLNFTGASAPQFNGVAASVFSITPTLITATVPAAATSGRITVTTAVGTATSAGTFAVKPTIAAFSPGAGPVGTSVVITGSKFTGTTGVTFNGINSAFVVNSSTQITATVPSGATTGPIRVVTPSGTGKSATNFDVAPTITSVTPLNGPPGTSVVIRGLTFKDVTSVQFGDLAATYIVNSLTKITATVPTGAVTGRITVRTTSGSATSTGTFAVP